MNVPYEQRWATRRARYGQKGYQYSEISVADLPSGARAIQLTRGRCAIVDEDLYAQLSAFSWYASESHDGRFYAATKPDSGLIYMHRLVHPVAGGLTVDHISGDTLDNRRANLRTATVSQNTVNNTRSRGASGYRGVWWNEDCQKWQVVVTLGGRRVYLGVYDSIEEAARISDEARQAHYGEFARLNLGGAAVA